MGRGVAGWEFHEYGWPPTRAGPPNSADQNEISRHAEILAAASAPLEPVH